MKLYEPVTNIDDFLPECNMLPTRWRPHAGRRFGASTAARRRSGAACDRAVVAHRQLVGGRFRRTHRRALWRRRRADPLSRPRGGVLAPGQPAYTVIKASDVMIGID